MKPASRWAFVLCLAVLATSRWAGPPGPDSIPGDAAAYYRVAQAAPDLPRDGVLPFQHTQRLAIPYAIGVLHTVLPEALSLHALFRAAAVALEFAILLVAAGILRSLRVPDRPAMLILAILALNPWAFRMYVTFPEMIPDLGFVVGLAVVLRGLLSNSVSNGAALVLTGQLLASLSRQSGLLLLPAIALWLWRNPMRWELSPVRRTALAGGAAAIAVAVYAGTARLVADVSTVDANAEHLYGAIVWFATQFDAGELARFSARIVLPVLVPLAVFVGLAAQRRTLAAPAALLLTTAACIWTQPILAGPYVTAGNAPRLIALGLLPVLLALGIQLRDSGAFATPEGGRRMGWLVALLALGSLHHWLVLDTEPTRVHQAIFAAASGSASIGAAILTARETS